MMDWIDNNPGKAFMLLCVAILGSAAGAISADSERKADFMVECRLDHKQYECDVLWGQANPDNGSDIAAGMALGTAIGISAGRR